LPSICTEPDAQTPVLKIEFAVEPRQQLGAGMMLLPADRAAWW